MRSSGNQFKLSRINAWVLWVDREVNIELSFCYKERPAGVCHPCQSAAKSFQSDNAPESLESQGEKETGLTGCLVKPAVFTWLSALSFQGNHFAHLNVPHTDASTLFYFQNVL